jgi:hypothetical protein
MGALMTPSDRDILEAALMGYERQRKSVEGKIEEIRALLGSPAKRKRGRPKSVEAAPRKKSKFSGETRQKMAEAQKRRWAAAKAGR